MLTRFGRNRGLFNWNWADFDRSFALLDALRRSNFSPARGGEYPMALSTGAGDLGADLIDAGEHFELHADVPGMTESDVQISLDRNVLTISGQRTIGVPEGYTAQRRERRDFSFSRSFTLPQAVDAEKTTATVKDGVLTIKLGKVPESQPRQITVTSA